MTKAQHRSSYVARLVTDEARARRISEMLMETLDPATSACAAFAGPDRRWLVEVYFPDKPAAAELRALGAVASEDGTDPAFTVEKVPARDWVKQSLDGLRPVVAGRFVVHGSHDRARVSASRIGIEIEAATAFGTGHHGTTRGCLLALDDLARRVRPRYVLDLGTGTGVLAIAAAKRLGVPVLATDIDGQAVRATRDNARNNAIGHQIEAVQAAGLTSPQVAGRAPFDLVLANILLGPLQRLAAPLARTLMPNARVILSGILRTQENAALSTYRSQGLMLERRFPLDEWITLVMVAKRR